VLLKVHSQSHGPFLTLCEIQVRPHRRIGLRTRAYAALAAEKYDLPVFVVVVNILPTAGGVEIVDFYHAEFLGQTAHQDFKVINLWEIDASLVFEQRLTSLLPFVPIMRGGQDERLVSKAVVNLRADESLSELEPLLAFFSRFVLTEDVVRRIMRWDMHILRESPWFNELIQEGIQQGIQQGIQRGIQQVEREREAMVLHILEHRFGPLPEVVADRVHTVPTDDLRRLVDVALDASDLTTVINFMAELPVKPTVGQEEPLPTQTSLSD